MQNLMRMGAARQNIKIGIVLLMLFTVQINCAMSQTYDSTFYPADSNAIFFFHNRLDVISPLELTSLDTTLVDFEEYGPVAKLYPFYATLGNVGLAYKNLDFSTNRATGFNYGVDAFNAYYLFDSDIDYYVNPRPYTEIGYITGAKKEQLFRLTHDQRIFKRLTFGLDFDLINSLGSYQRQKSDNNRLAVKMHYFTEDLRYGIIANYTHSKIKVRENGGILYDSIYEQNLEPSRSIIAVKLSRSENLLRKSGVYLQQYFQLSRKNKRIQDDTLSPKRRINLKFGRISHSFSYKRYSQLYTDELPDTNYYHNIYVDSTSTYDTVFFQKIENTFSWSNADYLDRVNPQPFVILFGIKHQFAKVIDTVSTAKFENLIPYAEIKIRPLPLLRVEGRGSYILTGNDYQGDFDLSGLATLEIMRNKPYKTEINFGMELDNHAAPYFFQHYFSNHFIWDNGFNKVNTSKVSAFLTQRRLKVGFDLLKIQDYIYIGADTLPKQFGQSVEILKAYLYKQFKLGKFDIDGRVVYQKVSEPDIIRLPEFMAYFTFTFNLKMFKGALHTRSGFDVNYFTKYYADAWMPAIRSFYIQDNNEIGGFFHIDFFIDFNVKRTRFFMKMQNILAGFGESNFYQVPHYPMQDMGFKFGLSWRFHD